MKKTLAPHLALILANSIWALDYPFYKLLMPHYVSPMAMVCTAVIVAALLSLIFSLFTGFEKVDRKDIPILIVTAFLTAVLRKLCLMNGMARTSPIDGSIIDSVDPVIVLVFAVLLHQERFSLRKAAGVALGLGGTILVVLAGAHKSHEASSLIGNLLVFMCAVFSAIYLVVFKKIVVKYKPITVLRWVYCIGALMLLPFGAKDVVHIQFSNFDTHATLLYLFVLLLPTFGPNIMLAWSLKYVSPTVSSMYGYIQPVLAALMAVVMRMDKLRFDTIAASVLIFIGVYLVIKNSSVSPASVQVKH